MTTDLKNALQDKFSGLELDEKKLRQLEKQLLASQEKKLREKSFRLGVPYWPAAAISVILCFLVLFSYDAYKMYRGKMLVNSLVSETVQNHLKLKPLEVKSARFDEVLDYFEMLEFNPIKSSYLVPKSGDTLLGGRYCTIQGADAAQLRVVSKDGRVSSWYQGMLPSGDLDLLPDVRKGQMPIQRSLRGLQTKLWQEGGVVFIEVQGMPQGT